MHPKLEQFIQILETESRADALAFIMDIYQHDGASFIDVYEHLLTPALNQMLPTDNENIDIWNEHIRTSIIKTIVENSYPYVVQARRERGIDRSKTIAILTPPEEFHSVGARMVKDVFTYLGYHSVFVGGNTPLRVLQAGMAGRRIDYVAISISNPYHLISTRDMIRVIREQSPDVKIIVGGNAIQRLGDKVAALEADHVLRNIDELVALAGGHHETGL